ncbi:hypothetical protein ACVFI8_19940 [Agarivorans sp. MS3-6]
MKATMMSTLIGVMLSAPLMADIPTEITLATTHWAPYTSGDSQHNPGIVSEYLSEILAKHQITLSIEYYPWTRAIKLANTESHIHGLLTAVHKEAPELLFTQTPIMNYKMSFFTTSDSNWQFTDKNSLQTLPTPFGVIAGYGYGEPIDSFIKDPNNRNSIHSIKGDNPQARLIKMLEYQRAAVIIEDERVIQRFIQDKSHVRFAGTLNQSPFYLAFKPTLSWAKEVILLLDKELAAPENHQRLAEITAKYVQ